MDVAVALILIPILFAAIGYVPARRDFDAWSIRQPVALPPPLISKLIWLGALFLFGLGVALAGVERELLLAIGFIVPLMAGAWTRLLVRHDAVRNAFFFLCAAWTVTAIVAAWVFALNPGASLLTVPLLAIMVAGAVANFFIWQRPPDTD